MTSDLLQAIVRVVPPRALPALAFAAVSIAYSPSAGAQDLGNHSPPPTVTASPVLRLAPSIDLDADEADVRTAWIQARLDAETPAAQRWYWGFLGISLVAIGGQIALGAIDSPGSQAGWYTGAINATIGTVPMIIVPFSAAFAAGQLRSFRATTPSQRIARMHRAESLLNDAADNEDFGASWVMHAFGAFMGIGSTAILAVGFQQQWFPRPPDDAGIALTLSLNCVLTIAFNEVQVLTQPTQLVRDRETYRRDGWRTMASVRRRPGVVWAPMAFPGGIGVQGVF